MMKGMLEQVPENFAGNEQNHHHHNFGLTATGHFPDSAAPSMWLVRMKMLASFCGEARVA